MSRIQTSARLLNQCSPKSCCAGQPARQVVKLRKGYCATVNFRIQIRHGQFAGSVVFAHVMCNTQRCVFEAGFSPQCTQRMVHEERVTRVYKNTHYSVTHKLHVVHAEQTNSVPNNGMKLANHIAQCWTGSVTTARKC